MHRLTFTNQRISLEMTNTLIKLTFIVFLIYEYIDQTIDIQMRIITYLFYNTMI